LRTDGEDSRREAKVLRPVHPSPSPCRVRGGRPPPRPAAFFLPSFLRIQSAARRAHDHCDKEAGRSSASLVHNSPMSIPAQQTPPVEERSGWEKLLFLRFVPCCFGAIPSPFWLSSDCSDRRPQLPPKYR